MARATSKSSSSPVDAVDAALRTRPDPTAAPDQSLEAARALLAHPIGAFQDALHGLLRLHTQQADALQAWVQTVDEAVRDTAAARDLAGLMAVTMKLTGRQYSLASAQWAEGWSQWLEGEVQLADRLRSEAVTLVEDLQPPEAAAAERQDAATVLAAWSRMQDQWRAATQRWIDAAQPGAAQR